MSPPRLIGPDYRNIDLSITKTTKFKERYAAKLMLEMFNATNTTKFDNPGTTFGTGTFGVISGSRSQAGIFGVPWNSARIMQMTFRFEF